jgi:two-component sensor histidine kinase
MERLFLLAARSRGLPIWARYGATTLIVLACFGLRLLVFGQGPGQSYLLFFPAVILAGVFFDRGTGIYAALLSSLIAACFLVEPRDVMQITDPTDLLTLLLFLAIAVFTACLLESLHIALTSLARERTSLAAANVELAGVAKARGTLLSEAVHRARNDLQRLAATLRLQAGAANEPAARQVLAEASGRIMGLARINARLDYHREDGQAEVGIRGFLDGLMQDIREVTLSLSPVALVVRAEDHLVPMARAVPIGLSVNELVGNALKYAFPDDMEGQVMVGFRREGEEFILTVEDNGIGSDGSVAPQGSGLGTRIARALAGQLGGHLESGPASPGSNRPGLRWVMRFPCHGPA